MFTINNMKKIGLKGAVKCFSFDFNPIDTNDIWWKEHDIKWCFGKLRKYL